MNVDTHKHGTSRDRSFRNRIQKHERAGNRPQSVVTVLAEYKLRRRMRANSVPSGPMATPAPPYRGRGDISNARREAEYRRRRDENDTRLQLVK